MFGNKHFSLSTDITLGKKSNNDHFLLTLDLKYCIFCFNQIYYIFINKSVDIDSLTFLINPFLNIFIDIAYLEIVTLMIKCTQQGTVVRTRHEDFKKFKPVALNDSFKIKF